MSLESRVSKGLLGKCAYEHCMMTGLFSLHFRSKMVINSCDTLTL